MTRFSLLIAAPLLFAAPALAGTITVSDRATVAAALGAQAVVETFGPDLAPYYYASPIVSGTLDTNSNFTPSSGSPIVPGMIKAGVTYSTPVGADYFFNIDNGGGFAGGFLNNASDPAALTLAFDAPLAAFGFDTNNLGGDSLTVVLSFVGGGTDTETLAIPDTDAMTGFGFTSSAPDILGATIQSNGRTLSFARDSFAVDNVTFGASVSASLPVMEPGSLGVLSMGLVSLGLIRRARPSGSNASRSSRA